MSYPHALPSSSVGSPFYSKASSYVTRRGTRSTRVRAGGGSQVSCRALPVDRMRYGLPELSMTRDHTVSASSREPLPCPFRHSQLSSVRRPHVETPNDGSFLPCTAVAMALGHPTTVVTRAAISSSEPISSSAWGLPIPDVSSNFGNSSFLFLPSLFLAK